MNKLEKLDGFRFFGWSSLDKSKGFINLKLPIWSVFSALPSLIIVNDLMDYHLKIVRYDPYHLDNIISNMVLAVFSHSIRLLDIYIRVTKGDT